jgi:hypothetical protein
VQNRVVGFPALVKKARKELLASSLASRYNNAKPEAFVFLAEGSREDQNSILTFERNSAPKPIAQQKPTKPPKKKKEKAPKPAKAEPAKQPVKEPAKTSSPEKSKPDEKPPDRPAPAEQESPPSDNKQPQGEE